jgi:5-methylcytosine-specific restriction endonuclease McrA
MRVPTTKNKCLLLNSDYSPIRILSWKQAIIIDFKHKNNINSPIEIIAYHENGVVHGTDQKIFFIPSVVRIKKYFNIYSRKINFSRKNLFIRDNFSCQYCGKDFPNSQLTYDHVIPKSRYKPNLQSSTNWTNIVTSCRYCNAKKGNKTPQEAGMNLLKKPYAPNYDNKYLSWHTDLHTIYLDDPSYEPWKPFIKNSI